MLPASIHAPPGYPEKMGRNQFNARVVVLEVGIRRGVIMGVQLPTTPNGGSGHVDSPACPFPDFGTSLGPYRGRGPPGSEPPRPGSPTWRGRRLLGRPLVPSLLHGAPPDEGGPPRTPPVRWARAGLGRAPRAEGIPLRSRPGNGRRIGPSVAVDRTLENGREVRLAVDLPVLGFVGRPEEVRRNKVDDLVFPGTWLLGPSSRLEFALPPETVMLDGSIQYRVSERTRYTWALTFRSVRGRARPRRGGGGIRALLLPAGNAERRSPARREGRTPRSRRIRQGPPGPGPAPEHPVHHQVGHVARVRSPPRPRHLSGSG